jgi:hypothetical protein
VDDERERVDRLAVDQDVQLDQVRRPVADLLVVHRGVALGAALELVVVVDDELGERELEAQKDPLGSRYSIPLNVPRRFVDSSMSGPMYWLGVTTLSVTHGSRIDPRSPPARHPGRVVDGDLALAEGSVTRYSTDGRRR